MAQPTASQDQRRWPTGLSLAVLLLLSLSLLHSCVIVETYELAAFEAHRSCMQGREGDCDRLLPPWQDADPTMRTLRTRLASAFGALPGLTLDAAHAAKEAALGALDALRAASEQEET